jgi:flagellar basal body P-ring protein FlgI
MKRAIQGRGTKHTARWRVPRLLFLLLCPLSLALAVGCAQQQIRSQAAEETDHDRYGVKTIGDVTSVANADATPLFGVGLVVGLDGTGSEAPPGDARKQLENAMQKDHIEHIRDILASKNNSIVYVTARLEPGVHNRDALTVQVMVPPECKTSSLRGGYLKLCSLYNYDSTRNLSPNANVSDRVLKGHALAVAEGPVQVGFNDSDGESKLRQGVIWDGGRAKRDNPFMLVMNSDQQYARLVSAIADRINETFQGPYRASGSEIARTQQTTSFLVLNVPPQYKYNLPRFLRVVRMIPLRETEKLRDLQENTSRTAGTSVAADTRMTYRKKLERELMDPGRTITAALRLEALGNDSIPVLKHGLESDHMLVRFSSAEALAYLDSSACGEELALLVDQQPALRAFSLTALASLNEAVSKVELRKLFGSKSAEARYGAFRALRALDDRDDDDVRGELLNNSFWLHRVAPSTAPLVHVSTTRRAEIVVFGKEPKLAPPFSLLSGEFTVNAGRDDTRCSLFAMHRGADRRQCSLTVEDIVRNLAEMGASYSEVVDILRQADQCQGMTCALAQDALPQATDVFDLVKEGQRDSKSAGAEEIRKAKADFGATPTLFEKTANRRSRTTLERDEEALLRESKRDDGKSARNTKLTLSAGE